MLFFLQLNATSLPLGALSFVCISFLNEVTEVREFSKTSSSLYLKP